MHHALLCAIFGTAVTRVDILEWRVVWMQGLKDRVAIVTGGNSGFGRATSLVLAKQGVRVAIAARSMQQAEETLGMMNGVGGKGIFIPTDHTQATEVEALIESTVATFGRLILA